MSVLDRLRGAGYEVYSREQWGTARPGAYETRKSTHPMPSGPAAYHFLHITVTADTDTQQQGYMGARQVESYGLSTPPMVSYHMLTTNEGRAYEGQNYGTKGTHTINDKNVAGFPDDLNLHGYAVAVMQNVADEVTDVQVRLAAATFAAVELEGFVRRGAAIHPHRMFAAKECPGDKAVARLDEIRRLKDQYVIDGLGNAQEDEMTDDDKKWFNGQFDRLQKQINERSEADKARDRRLQNAVDDLPATGLTQAKVKEVFRNVLDGPAEPKRVT